MPDAIEPFNMHSALPLEIKYLQANIAGRDAIPVSERYEGMPCYTIAEHTLWILWNGTANGNWTPLFTGVGAAAIPKSREIRNTDWAIDWAVDIAPDATGAPSGQTFAQRFGNTPNFAVYMLNWEVSQRFEKQEVPIATILDGSNNIETAIIELSGINSIIIIS